MNKRPDTITIKAADFDDLKYALSKGAADFFALPYYGLFFGFIFVLGGWLLVSILLLLKLQWPIYPLAIGFALIGPFIATGLYDVSRRRENKLELSFRNILGVIWDQKNRELGWMAFVMLFIFWIWMYQARTVFVVFFGFGGFASVGGFLEAVLTTQEGWLFLITGHFIGAIISLVLYVLTVISCPLLLDKDVDFVTAMLTSIRTVLKSPVTMIGWGGFVILSILFSAVLAFLPLLFVLPILGHATWHLYRRLIIQG